MFQNTKCECGHQNPVGTVLCESCGKPLDEALLKDENALLEMRYDGVARRSQKANPHFVDRIWNFFSSVKIAVYLIVITLIGAAFGTILQQESTIINLTERSEFAAYYKEQHGTFGVIYHALGLSRTYESWWFIGLLVMIGTSLVVCSLDRVLPLYRALSKQQIRKHLQFINRQHVVYSGELTQDKQEWLDRFAKELKRKRYRVWREDGALLAEKNRFSRWGPYINHIGLIVFLLAVLGRSIPAWHMDQYLTLYEGETRQIPGTNYYLKNDKFTLDYYSDEELASNQKGTKVVKLYETKARLYECTDACDDPTREPVLTEVKQHDIRVNSALAYKGLKVYQNSFQEKVRFISVHATLKDKVNGTDIGSFDLKMNQPEEEYKLGEYTLRLIDYYPDFGLDEQTRPMTKSRDPNNPAFVFRIAGPGIQDRGEVYVYFPMPSEKSKYYETILNESFKQRGDNSGRFSIQVDNPIVDGQMNNIEYSAFTTYLNIRMDRAMPYVWVGAAISMIGLIMGFYWQHRRIWIRIDGDKLALGGHTNKNTYGLRADVAGALGKTRIEVDPKTLDNRRNER
ncbi:cytochrome C biogenesis protein ResB [Cohnella sp. CIP 111063]|uniref:cytochrome c biogenesis protein ResB n=1 Tax=unclassified Cohnella TaxID=2636738 RepID=UPI000B8C38CD|nr:MULTISPECIES: cytochrome c biogenesis protein ResB [unclassified Cohnella]OXS61248.1 cytochrome C biogenesis protein ResB [Cohnella sp. CIP 111063]PRX73821.1 cytochrome c biogenesis protein [Cohnella sp. SGD-V74]